jgi:hypothetical protein
MEYMNALKEEINKVLTENEDTAYKTTGSYCLDFFSLVGGLRHHYEDAMNLFIRAYYENPITAIKLLFYTRDIREGLGERNTFRFLFNYLCNFQPDVAKQIVEYVPLYGRYDDLLGCLHTKVEDTAIDLIQKQLFIDEENYKEGKSVSLLSKWLPSCNTSSCETRKMAKYLVDKLQMREEDYRKMLSRLRKGRILENYLREKDYTFDYSKQPSQAMYKYSQAFLRNDEQRYQNYLTEVSEKKKSLKCATLYPYQLIRDINLNSIWDTNKPMDKNKRNVLNTTWASFDRKNLSGKTIVVLDGSGSMYEGVNPRPIDVALSLAMLFSEQLEKPFQDTFITFSEKPQLVKMKGKDFVDRAIYASTFCEAANTDIAKVYELILTTAINHHIAKEKMIDRLVIISDMEFDYCTKNSSSYSYYKNAFEAAGYDMVEVVFWNVNTRTPHLPITCNDKKVKLVSGASPHLFEMVCKNEVLNPYDFMMECLKKYSVFDQIKL